MEWNWVLHLNQIWLKNAHLLTLLVKNKMNEESTNMFPEAEVLQATEKLLCRFATYLDKIAHDPYFP